MSNLSKAKNENGLMEHMMNPLIGLRHEVTKAMHDFYDLFERGNTNLASFQNLHLSPAMDLVEEKDKFAIQLEMPGIDEKDVKVSVNNNILSIHAEKSISKKHENKRYVSREIGYGQYTRHIALPLNANVDKITASLKKSILTVNIPKKADAKGGSRDIKVSVQ